MSNPLWPIQYTSVLEAVRVEMEGAEDRFGPFTSSHEGFGVLAEEMSELLEAIHANDGDRITAEAVQVSAVAARIATSLIHPQTRKRSGIVE